MSVERSAVFFMFGALGFLLLLIIGFDVEPPTAALLLIGLSVGVIALIAFKPNWSTPKLTIQQKAILVEFDFYIG